MVDTFKANDNLKRKLDMEMGHVGEYAGYDDDEFEEIGEAQPPWLQRARRKHN